MDDGTTSGPYDFDEIKRAVDHATVPAPGVSHFGAVVHPAAAEIVDAWLARLAT